MRIAVVIPALNEKDGIKKVIRALPTDVHIVVIDNGSTDGTADAAKMLGATVCFEPRRGYGSAVARGFQYLKHLSPDIAVVIDADFSDDPTELPRLIAPILRNDADLVIGSRTLGTHEPGSLSVPQRFGNALTAKLLRWRFGQQITDLGPFRALRYSIIDPLQLKDLDFGWNVEMQIRALQQNLRIVEIPVTYRRRVGTSKISGTVRGTILAGIKILKVSLTTL